jgi:hypothetical protein
MQPVSGAPSLTGVSPSELLFAFHDGTLFLSCGGLYALKNSKSWSPLPFAPFSRRTGQSMTSTTNGLAFFGGNVQSIFYNDLWLYADSTWSYVVTSIPARSFHAAASNHEGGLVICGGEKDECFRDFYVVNLATQVTTVVEFDNLLAFSHHTLTFLPDSKTYCIMGGYCSRRLNQNVYILDPEARSITSSNHDFRITELVAHRVEYGFDLLFVSGAWLNGRESDVLWMYHLGNAIWIPLDLQARGFKPFYVFPKVAQGSIVVVDSTLSQTTEIAICSSMFTRNDPMYIEFLRKHLVAGQKYFSRLESAEKLEGEDVRTELWPLFKKFCEKVIQNDPATSVIIDKASALRQAANRVQALLSSARDALRKMESADEIRPEDEASFDFSSTIDGMIANSRLRRTQRQKFNEISEELSARLECVTVQMNLRKPQQVPFDPTAYESSLLLSQQLSDKLSLLQSECTKLEPIYEESETTMENLRSRVLSLYRQVQAVSNVKKSIDQQTRLAKERTFTALRRVLDLRVYDEHVAEFRPAASHLVMQSARERKLVEMVEEKAQMTAELVQIASTLGETEAEPATLLRLTEIIQKLDLANQNAEKPIMTETDGVFTDFLSSLGKPDLLMSDLEKAIKIIDDELERSQSK